MDYKLALINLIVNTDLGAFTEDNGKLEFAIDFAKGEVANRFGCAVADIPAKFDANIVNGAVWFLARMGSEGETQNSEGNVSRVYQEIPDWLKSITPKVGVVKLAGTR